MDPGLGPRGQWDSRVGAEFLLRILDFFESKTASQPADMLSLVLRRLGAMPNEQERYLVGRYFDLMVTRPRAKWGPPSPFDQAFREALSFSIEEYLALGYALVAGLIPIATVADLAASRFDQIVRVASSTIAHLPNAHEVERTLCAPVDWYRTETMDFPKDPNPGLTNLEPLYDKPLVRVPSGGVLPVSRSLLLQRLTLGIYWEVFTNKRLQAHGVVDVNAALGGLYQDYCTEALRAATAGRGVSQIIAESEVTGAPADSKPDLVVKEGRRWIVIETTVSTLKRRTLIQGDADAFRKEIAPKSHLGKKFRQPLAAATNLISGRTSCEDLPVGEVEEIVPVVLFLHPFPQHAVIRRELESAYQLPKVLRRPTGGADIKVLPLQLISTEEMEIMEPLLQKGGSLGALLLTRQDGDPFIAGGPLKNALMALPGWQEPDNPRMKELMDEMAVRCTPMLQSDRGEERNSPTDTP